MARQGSEKNMRTGEIKDLSEVEAAEVSAIESVTAEFNPDPFFARGDCRDAMLEVIRSAVNWSGFNEERQRDINVAVDNASKDIVAKLVRGLAADGRKSFHAQLDQVVIKDGLKIVAKASFDGDVLIMLGSTKFIEVTIADPSAHDNERGPARVDPDQAELLSTDSDDLLSAADPVVLDADIMRTGDCVTIKDQDCEIEIDLKSEMVMATPRDGNAIADRFEVRAATTKELKAERDRTAEFAD